MCNKKRAAADSSCQMFLPPVRASNDSADPQACRGGLSGKQPSEWLRKHIKRAVYTTPNDQRCTRHLMITTNLPPLLWIIVASRNCFRSTKSWACCITTNAFVNINKGHKPRQGALQNQIKPSKYISKMEKRARKRLRKRICEWKRKRLRKQIIVPKMHETGGSEHQKSAFHRA